MTRDEIITIIRAKIDEVNPDPATTELHDVFGIIDAIAEESANTLMMKAPLHLLTAYDFPTATWQYPSPTGAITQDYGYMGLPTDYLRLAVFKMQEWQVPVTDAISEQHPLFLRQFNKYLKGKPSNPVCAIATAIMPLTGEMDKAIMYVSVPGKNHRYEIRRYIKRVYHPADIPTPNLYPLKGLKDLPDSIIEGVTWQAAGDVLVAIQQAEKANAAYTKVQEFITVNIR
jgi:hypothetical protein